jgi:hypothetical protein
MVIRKLIPFVCVLEEQIIVDEWLEQHSRCDLPRLPVAILVSRSFNAINLGIGVVFSRKLVGVVVYKLNSNTKMLDVMVV